MASTYFILFQYLDNTLNDSETNIEEKKKNPLKWREILWFAQR